MRVYILMLARSQGSNYLGTFSTRDKAEAAGKVYRKYIDNKHTYIIDDIVDSDIFGDNDEL